MSLCIIVLLLVITIPVSIVCYLGWRLHIEELAAKDATIRTICPKCHHQIVPQHFLCPTCRSINRLVPDEKFLYYQQCSCGAVLPKTTRKGRYALTAICPSCHYIIGKGIGECQDIVVPIVGGPSAGKSALLSAWIAYASSCFSQRSLGVQISFPFPGDDHFANSVVQHWSRGVRPDKTSNLMPNGFGMDIVNYHKKDKCRLYCYDPAGECFDHVRNLKNFSYYDYMDGVIFLIDPFSMPSVRRKYVEHLPNAYSCGFQYSDRDVNDYCDRFINSLKQYYQLAEDEYHSAYCAVVITKADMFDLDKQIGVQALQMIKNKHPSLREEEAIHIACTKFLETNGFGDILQKLNERFKEVRCFSISAFGHMPDTGAAYLPIRVELPFLWIIDSVCNCRKKTFLLSLFNKRS